MNDIATTILVESLRYVLANIVCTCYTCSFTLFSIHGDSRYEYLRNDNDSDNVAKEFYSVTRKAEFLNGK